MKQSKTIGLIIIALIYLITFTGCYFLYDVFKNIFGDNFSSSPLIIILILDVIATTLVFIFSTIFNNASIYDPYWSVAPIFMLLLYMVKLNCLTDPHIILMLVVFIIWGVRLTYNWIYTFKNLSIQDWRYENLKTKHPKVWPLINLGGIHLFPTMVVFIAMIPAFNYIEKICAHYAPTLGTYFGALLAIVAVIIEAVADIQMHRFLRKEVNKNAVNDKGLWKMSRHPNYFGEFLFWASICIMGLSFFNDNTSDLLIFSPLVVFVMFVTISIPMMEKRQKEKRPEYKEYMERTPIIFPLGQKEKK